MKSWLASIGMGLLFGWAGAPARAQAAGDVLPAPAPGGLDIHHINTGEGSAAFFVLPDGTTLLVDCGFGQDLTRPPKYKAPRKPDDSRLPGEWVARYLRKVHPLGELAAIDYVVISHFHGDHMGGVPELLRHVRVERFFDRGWPDYQEPHPFGGPLAALYKAAVRGQAERHGMRVQRFEAGTNGQIVLRHRREGFPAFEVRNLAVNGEVWTGQGNDVRRHLAAGEKPSENALSIALRVRYGRFDYFTGGDLPGASASPAVPAWRDMEAAVAAVTGPIDVAVLNHHGNSDASSAFFLGVLQPRVCIAQVWAARQVDPETWARLRSEQLYPGPRDIFSTNGMWEGRVEHIVRVFGDDVGRRHVDALKGLAADQGHIVVRVAPGGASYRVLVLDDSDESQRVRSVHGPYTSR